MMISETQRLRDKETLGRVRPVDDTQGHGRLRAIVDDQQPGRVRPVKDDDTEGHSRFGFFLDAEHPVDQSQPEQQASQGGDVEGQQT